MRGDVWLRKYVWFLVSLCVFVTCRARGAGMVAVAAEELPVGEIVEVTDGDSLTVEYAGEQHAVCLLGIDAPETIGQAEEDENNPLAFGLDFSRDMQKAMRRHGLEARQFLRDRLPTGTRVRLDVRGRTEEHVTAKVFSEGQKRPMGMQLVAAGLARVKTGEVDFAGELDYVRAQVAAMAKGVGVWALLDDNKNSDIFFIGIYADAEGHDRENLRQEQVMIGNIGGAGYDLSRHLIVDEANHDYLFPRGTFLAPGDCVLVVTGMGDDEEGVMYQDRRGPVWNNEGDTVHLLDPDGAVLSRMSFHGGNDAPRKP